MNRKSGHALIYVVVLLSFISLCFIGALKAQTAFSAMSQANIIGKQSELLAENALRLAHPKLLAWEGHFPEEVQLLEEELGPQGKVKAIARILPSKYRFIEVKGIGSARADSKGSKKAFYAYGKTSLKRDWPETKDQVNRLEQGNTLFEGRVSQGEKKSSSNYLFFERPEYVKIGRSGKLLLKEGDLSISRLPETDFKRPHPLKVELESPLTVAGDMEVIGDLYLNEPLSVRGDLRLKGKLFLGEEAKLHVSGKIFIDETLKEEYLKEFFPSEENEEDAVAEERQEDSTELEEETLDQMKDVLKKMEFIPWPEVKQRYFFLYTAKE